MSRTDLRSTVLEHIALDPLVELTRELVRIPSITGDEGALADFVIAWMREHGIQAEGLPVGDGRHNVQATVGNADGPRLLMTSHIDTMEAGDESAWTYPPFEGHVVDGRLYGRGATDSMGGLAAAMVALAALQVTGAVMQGQVVLLGTVEGENLGPNGLNRLVDEGKVDVDAVIYCSHSELEVQMGFKGIAWLKLTFNGRPAHASLPHSGVNALEQAAAWVTKLPALMAERPGHPLIGRPTFVPTWTKSGTSARYNLIPDRCEVGLDARLVPPDTMESFTNWVRSTVDDSVEVEFIDGNNPFQLADDAVLLTAIQSAFQEATGQAPRLVGHIGGGTITPLIKRGIPGLGFGPGHLERCNAHAPDEFIDVDQLLVSARVYALTALEFLHAQAPVEAR